MVQRHLAKHFKSLESITTILQAHNDLIKTYEAKLASFGVSTEELGFQPLKSTVAGQSLGQGPAGLVASLS